MLNKIINTEIGSIPSDWKLVPYGEIFDFCRTASYSREQLSDTNEIGYVHYGDIHTKFDFFLDLNKVKLPTIGKELSKNFTMLRDGDLIIADASEDYEGIGKSIETKNVGNKKAIAGLHTLLLRDKNESVADGFKGYIHGNQLVKKQINTLATGLKVYGISKNSLKRILIPLPPTKKEQTAIATALSDADALISSLERLIAKKKAIKQGAMQNLLKRKEGWKIKKIKDVAPLQRGYDLPSNKLQSGHYPVVYSNGIINYHSEYKSKSPGIVTGRSGTIGKVSFIETDFWPHNTTLWVTSFKGNFPKFIYYLFAYIKIEQFATGSGVPTLNRNDLHDYTVSIPSFEEQKKISIILSDMDAEIALLEKKLEKQKLIKQGMMQVLLTGKVRLL